MPSRIHVIALNIPWPANYGGVIDIYYKLLALKRIEVDIILHCFEYDRPQAEQLNSICSEVYYYPRKTGWKANLSTLPYNVYGRKAPKLLKRLLQDEYPILFEGLHSCYYLSHPLLRKRYKVFRACNIEHHYYRAIGDAEKNPLKKIFYYTEALRFQHFEQTVQNADLLLAVSQTEAEYLQKTFPNKQVQFIPCFHENETISTQTGSSDFILYHGKLSVKENEEAVLYLIKYIFSQLPYPCIVAGMDPPNSLYQAATPYRNIKIEANPSSERMKELMQTAHINMLFTFQGTGLKLKLLNSLFAGRHTIVNPTMLVGSGLDSLCHIAHSPEEAINYCHQLMQEPFSEKEIEKRKAVLYPAFSNQAQAELLMHIIGQHKQ
ncbi:glycosyltransferase [Porphyromonas circumdentaria]|uniref:Uncharacterized protein n=1 Tax=Porphyromonas circumdentaria TaxID=29524 RepID=A0A1T4Q1I1_9PORP|nr:glycosyltransferase [Porphyromonas circumdentaria]MBB6276439.1 hypothetical protein [Porphyromonas circumdentaria]MDO4723078.1 glycosyltransferase [Porphyromonas circumdentaria]SJZ97622.1 hypothetical protein SAMN02745171_01671 [Porphyromonas circumdentaria]